MEEPEFGMNIEKEINKIRALTKDKIKDLLSLRPLHIT